MKLKWDAQWTGKALDLLNRYKYVLVVIAAGILLLLWPSGEGEEAAAQDTAGLTGTEEDLTVEVMEEKLSDILSQVDGAGKVTVMLTVKQGMERVLAADEKRTASGDSSKEEWETVVVDGEAILVTQYSPVFQGALVVCPGGDDPEVKLLLTQAVAALTGLGTDHITVCKGG
jgi:stage III sporulation protein AG